MLYNAKQDKETTLLIVEFVQFTYPPGLTRQQILEDARTTVPRWRANNELIRKHYIVDGAGGAFYIWPSKEAAQHGHNAEGSRTSRPALARFRLSAISI